MSFPGKSCIKQELFGACFKKKSFVKKYLYNLVIQNDLSIQITSNHKLLDKFKWNRKDQLKKESFVVRHFSSFIELRKILYIQLLCKNIVYDIENIEYLNFINNNLVLHNSIEQDADLVLMIHKIVGENQDQIGTNSQVIDVLISKNRNGPVGSFQLMFDGSISTFTNINKKY